MAEHHSTHIPFRIEELTLLPTFEHSRGSTIAAENQFVELSPSLSFDCFHQAVKSRHWTAGGAPCSIFREEGTTIWHYRLRGRWPSSTAEQDVLVHAGNWETVKLLVARMEDVCLVAAVSDMPVVEALYAEAPHA
jgi:hypothetical protein